MRGWTPKALARISAQAMPYRWSPAWAENVAIELRREPADVLVADFVLLGALRDGIANAAARRIYRRDGLPFHNRARQQPSLPPLGAPLEQYGRAARVLILASAAFHFSASRLPPNVRYFGTPLDDTGATWDYPWIAEDDRPLVLISLSTLQQGQTEVMRRIVVALDWLPVRALAALGPTLAGTASDAPPNARLEAFVPHGAVPARAAVLVTQCGLSAVAKALAHGVPMACIPLIADQPDNAARVVAPGAGCASAAMHRRRRSARRFSGWWTRRDSARGHDAWRRCWRRKMEQRRPPRRSRDWRDSRCPAR